jgi:hypothetical protein
MCIDIPNKHTMNGPICCILVVFVAARRSKQTRELMAALLLTSEISLVGDEYFNSLPLFTAVY